MKNEQYLPNSSRRFKVTTLGVVKTRDGTIVPTKLIDGNHYVEIEWLNGKDFYQVGLLVLATFGKIGLPEYLYSEIEILYSDLDCNNLSLGNILYRFRNGPLEVEEYQGYFYIPMYTDYAVNRHGELINIKTGRYKVWSITKPGMIKNQTGGYFYNRTVNDDGRSVTLFRHRALCLVFKRYDGTVKQKYVNHKNGQPGDDWLDNLEWVTPKENNEHAILTGLKGDNKPVMAWDLTTNEITCFVSIARCAIYVAEKCKDGIDKRGMVTERLRKKDFRIYQDKWLFKYNDGTKWPDVDLNNLIISRNGKANEVVCRNVFTKEILIFRGVPDAVELTGVAAGNIHTHLRNGKRTPTNGWLFRYKDSADDLDNWPEFTAMQLQIFEAHPLYPPNGVVVIDNRLNTRVFYTSVAVAINELNFTKSVLWKYIQSGGTPDGHYSFELIEVNPKVTHVK